MFSRRSLAFAFACTALPGTASQSQTLDQRDVSICTLLSFQVSEAVAQRHLPAGWQVNPLQSVRSRRANLIVAFSDQMAPQDADGSRTAETLNHAVVLVVPARNAAEAEGWMIIHGFSARPQGVSGAYGNFIFADSNMERIIRSRGGVRENQENWSFATPDGERLHLRLRYPPSPPTWGRIEALTFWPVFVGGHYRFDMSYQGLVLLRSTPIALDRISEVSFNATGPRMSVLFDGSERLVSVLSMPWQVRHAFVVERPNAFEVEAERRVP